MTQSETIVVESTFQGPRGSGNGGYVGGVMANRLDAAAVEVTLRAPVPLEERLELVRRDNGSLALRQGEGVLSEARAAHLTVQAVPPPFDWSLAERLRETGGSPADSLFGSCVSCGRARGCGDGLQVWGNRIPGHSGRSLALYRAHANHADAEGGVRPELIWAALDCIGAWAAQDADNEQPALTGRMTTEIYRRPQAGERCLVHGWRIAAHGRRLQAATALYGENGTLYALAEQIWVVLKA